MLGQGNKFRAGMLYVSPSILAPRARTGGPIGTGEASFDAPEHQKDVGDHGRVIGTTWHVPCGAARTLAKTFNQACRSNQWMGTTQRLLANSHYKWAGVFVLKANMRFDQHVPDGKNCLNMGSLDFLNY